MSDAKHKQRSRFQFPWTRRADEERTKRIESAKKLDNVLQDWHEITSNVDAIEKEIRINNWTITAKSLFSGGDQN